MGVPHRAAGSYGAGQFTVFCRGVAPAIRARGGRARLPRRVLALKIAHDLVYVRHRGVRYQLELLVRTAVGIVGIRDVFGERQAWEAKEAASILAGARSEAAP